jgi:hypothetical protein
LTSTEDLLIPMGVTDLWIAQHMAGSPPAKVAAARAFASAKMNPGMLYKITCHDAGEAVAVAEGLALLVSRVDFLKDRDHPSSKSDDGWPILELTRAREARVAGAGWAGPKPPKGENGSGILIMFEKEGRAKT